MSPAAIGVPDSSTSRVAVRQKLMIDGSQRSSSSDPGRDRPGLRPPAAAARPGTRPARGGRSRSGPRVGVVAGDEQRQHEHVDVAVAHLLAVDRCRGPGPTRGRPGPGRGEPGRMRVDVAVELRRPGATTSSVNSVAAAMTASDQIPELLEVGLAARPPAGDHHDRQRCRQAPRRCRAAASDRGRRGGRTAMATDLEPSSSPTRRHAEARATSLRYFACCGGSRYRIESLASTGRVRSVRRTPCWDEKVPGSRAIVWMSAWRGDHPRARRPRPRSGGPGPRPAAGEGRVRVARPPLGIVQRRGRHHRRERKAP